MPFNPIFIMGPPRSGTRLLARMLGRSNGCYLITEHKDKSKLPEETNRVPDREYWDSVFPERVGEEVNFDQACFDKLLSLWTQHADGNQLVKDPNNLIREREIRRAFSGAQFVGLVRNPWAVIQSMLGGREAGGKRPKILRAQEVLQNNDPMLCAAASWAIGIHTMRDLLAPTDMVTPMRVWSRSHTRN